MPVLPASLILPPRLREVHLIRPEHAQIDAQINALLVTLSGLGQLESLTLERTVDASGMAFASVDFALLRPPSLRSFTLSTPHECTARRVPFTLLGESGQAHHSESARRCAALLSPITALIPSQRDRTRLQCALTCGIRHVGQPRRYAHHVEHRGLQGRRIFPQMRCLTSLDLSARMIVGRWDLPAPILLDAFHCPSLTTLVLAAPFDSAQMAQLLPRMPLLRSLSLRGMSELESLAFFAQCDAAQSTLQELTILSCRHHALRPTELFHLTSLTALTSLRLEESFRTPLDQFGQRVFAPPSRLLPQLQQFKYVHDPLVEVGTDSDDDLDWDAEIDQPAPMVEMP